MGIADYFNGPKYKAELEELQKQFKDIFKQNENLKKQLQLCGALDLYQINHLIEASKSELKNLNIEIKEINIEKQKIKQESDLYRQEILVLKEDILLESFALYTPKFSFTTSSEYKEKLSIIRERQKNLIKNGNAAHGNMNWEVNGKKSEGQKLVKDMMKLLIRSFNNECDYCVDNVKFDNIELGIRRIEKSFETCNKLGRVMTVSLSHEYFRLKIDELHLSYEYQQQKQKEKEEAKRIREELREQQKLEQEIRSAREKIAKERKHFTAAIKDLQLRIQKSTSIEDQIALAAKIQEVEASRSALENEEKIIDYREQNAKAGYVYVISNVGAFGEGIYKIGMTRRLEPMDRVDELGDASVPFWFDVHAMVFSDNAPVLEAQLHERFAAGRLNKVNGRKEFFRANLHDIEAVIRAHYDAVVEVIHEAPAEQYRESLRMSMPSADIQQTEHALATSMPLLAIKPSSESLLEN